MGAAKIRTNPRKGRRGRNPNIPKALTLAREIKAFELAQRGWTQQEIAEKLTEEFGVKISQPAVCKALARVEADYIESIQKKVGAAKARQLARLEGIYFEGMHAWHASKAGTKRTSKRTKKNSAPGKMPSDAKGGVSMVQIETGSEDETKLELMAKHGEPRFLEVSRGALADIRALLGLNAPTRTLSTEVPPSAPLDELTDEQLDRQLAEAEARLEAASSRVTKPRKDVTK